MDLVFVVLLTSSHDWEYAPLLLSATRCPGNPFTDIRAESTSRAWHRCASRAEAIVR